MYTTENVTHVMRRWLWYKLKLVLWYLDPGASPKDRDSASEDEGTQPPPAKRMKSSSSDVSRDDEDSGGEVFESDSKDELKNITVDLEGKELWERFSELGTEMIITKAGRWSIRELSVGMSNVRLTWKKRLRFASCHQLILALTANKSVPEVNVVKKIRSCFVNSFFTFP